jgi:hypothetical protein
MLVMTDGYKEPRIIDNLPVPEMEALFFQDNGFGKKSLGIAVKQYIDASMKMYDICGKTNTQNISFEIQSLLDMYLDRNKERAKSVLEENGIDTGIAKNAAFKENYSLNNPPMTSILSDNLISEAICKKKENQI